jgi:Domain of unknown function (DUF932)
MALLNRQGQPLVAVSDAQPVNSFTQDQRHTSKSAKFVPVKPQWGAEILNEYGYFLKSLNVGRARKLENAAHQTTIATYQNETPQAVGDIFARITLKIPHIYGAIVPYWGFLRLSCLNGNALKLSHTNVDRIPHTGNALSQFEATVREMVSHVDQLNDSIRAMQAREVNATQVADFVREVATLRLGTSDNIQNVQFGDLLKVRRQTDSGRDAFTTYQVVQENLMRFGLRYQTVSEGANGTVVRNLHARPITRTNRGEIETVRSVDLNASLYDTALKILMGGNAA